MVMNATALPHTPPASIYRKVLDSRKRRVRGLWKRKGRFFANLTVAERPRRQNLALGAPGRPNPGGGEARLRSRARRARP